MTYKTIDVSTLKGIKQAERLQNKGYNETENGYKVTPYGIDKLRFEIPTKTK